MKKILIAEDNDSNFVLMSYILKKYYQFERARNGQEAVEMVDKGQYDIVLMDIKMPIMNGLEATSHAWKPRHHIPGICRVMSWCGRKHDTTIFPTFYGMSYRPNNRGMSQPNRIFYTG